MRRKADRHLCPGYSGSGWVIRILGVIQRESELSSLLPNTGDYKNLGLSYCPLEQILS